MTNQRMVEAIPSFLPPAKVQCNNNKIGIPVKVFQLVAALIKL